MALDRSFRNFGRNAVGPTEMRRVGVAIGRFQCARVLQVRLVSVMSTGDGHRPLYLPRIQQFRPFMFVCLFVCLLWNKPLSRYLHLHFL